MAFVAPPPLLLLLLLVSLTIRCAMNQSRCRQKGTGEKKTSTAESEKKHHTCRQKGHV
jgi:hypothetical protein